MLPIRAWVWDHSLKHEFCQDISSKKNNPPSPSNYQLSKDPRSGTGLQGFWRAWLSAGLLWIVTATRHSLVRYLCHVQNTASQSTPPNSPALTLFPPLLLVCFLGIGSRGCARSSQYSSVKTNFIYIYIKHYIYIMLRQNIYYILQWQYIILSCMAARKWEANERDWSIPPGPLASSYSLLAKFMTCPGSFLWTAFIFIWLLLLLWNSLYYFSYCYNQMPSKMQLNGGRFIFGL